MPDNIGYQEIAPQTVVPAGYTGIYDEDDFRDIFRNVYLDIPGKYILMNNLNLDATPAINNGIGMSSNIGDWEMIETSLPYGVEINHIAFGNGRFVATTDTNKILVFTDELGWQYSEFIFPGDITYLGLTGEEPMEIIYGNGIWLLYTYSNDPGNSEKTTFYSSVNGLSWQEAGTISSFQPTDIAYGDGLFCVVGYYGKLYTSADGATWTERDSDFPANYIEMYIDYDEHNGAWIVVGNNGAQSPNRENKIGTSSDGMVWYANSFGDGRDKLIGVACGSGLKVVARRRDAYNYLSLVDGYSITFSYQYPPTFCGAPFSPWLCFSGGYFILGCKVKNEYYISIDGMSWDKKFFREPFSEMAYGNNTWIAIKKVEEPYGWRTLSFLDGVLDGNGYEIRGLSAEYGLFVYLTYASIIKNLKIIDAQTHARGAILSGMNDGTVENCYVSGNCSLVYQSCGDIRNCTADVTIDAINVDYGAIISDAYSGMIKNCCSSGIIKSLSGSAMVGGIACNLYDCELKNCYSICDIVSSGGAGGIACFLSAIAIENCYFDGNIYCTGSSAMAAGLITVAYSDIEDCYVAGNVTCNGQSAAGFVCELYGNVKNCYANNIVMCNNGCKGGGFVANSYIGTIEQCYHIGKVEGNKSVAGFIGTSWGNIIRNCYSIGDVILHGTDDPDWHLAGGFIADGAGDWSNCYCVGKVISLEGEKYFAGGFLAWLYDAWESSGGIITNCYFDATLSGMPDDGKGTPKTTEQLKQRKTYQGWDFTNIWAIDPLLNYGYPYLQGSSPPPLPGIAFEIIFGPVTFGISHLEKRVRKVSLVVSKESDAVMLVATSASDIGDFAFEREVAAGEELDMHKIYLPMVQGDPSGGLAYRVRIRGIGRVQIHDISFDVSVRRAW